MTRAESLNARGIQNAKENRLAEAEQYFRQALNERPDYADALANLGTLLVLINRAAAALPIFMRRAALGPMPPGLMLNFSSALIAHGRMKDAESILRVTEDAAPSSSTASNLGNVLRDQGQLDEALRWFDRAVERAPQVAEYRYNRALALLLAGRYRDGWADYEWRRRKTSTSLALRTYEAPLWDGSPMAGTLFVYPEQGLGDTLQFIRFLPEAAKRAGAVAFECSPQQCRLISPFAAAHGVELCAAPPAVFTAHTSLMSVPHALGLELTDIERSATAYLTADPALADLWRGRLDRPGLKIGIAWQGSPDYARDAERSIALQYFAPLTNVPGVQLVSLQKGYGTEQIAHFGAPIIELGADVDAAETFVDTAAILASLDLVITSDTSIAHLAGTMGVTTWLLLPFVPDWRWLTGRDDSPWYPSMRLFRQNRPRDWTEVFDRVSAALAAMRPPVA